MTEYDRIRNMRLALMASQDGPPPIVLTLSRYDDEPPDLCERQHTVSSTEACGVRYQRCGGGVRIIRKKPVN